MTSQLDIECRHPAKIKRHLTGEGLSPELTQLYRDLGARMQAYGIDVGAP